MNANADDEWRGYQKKKMSEVLEEMKSLCEVHWIPPGHPLVFSSGCLVSWKSFLFYMKYSYVLWTLCAKLPV